MTIIFLQLVKTYLAVGIIIILYQLSIILYLWQLVQYNVYHNVGIKYVVVTVICVFSH